MHFQTANDACRAFADDHDEVTRHRQLRGVIVDSGYRVPEGTVVESDSGIGDPPVLSIYTAEATAQV